MILSRRTGMGLEEFVATCAHATSGAFPKGHDGNIFGTPTCTECRQMWRRVHAIDAPRAVVGEGSIPAASHH
jgi:hypothetical protein